MTAMTRNLRGRMAQALMVMVKPGEVFFTAQGPTKAAWDAWEGGTLSSGEMVLFNLAMALWLDGTPQCPRVDELWTRLDKRCYARAVEVLSLLFRAREEIERQLDSWAV